MSLDTRMTFERQQPSVELRSFLDPLKPGDYFDCGEARLFGIDEALEEEALRRGRHVGDDEFQLVATDGGLIFCRASIMFAIAARWKDLTIGRPLEDGREGEAVLPISWPTHGDLRFTVSRRLGSNVFRRWLQLQAQATRRSQVEQSVFPEPDHVQTIQPVNGAEHPAVIGGNGHPSIDLRDDIPLGGQLPPAPEPPPRSNGHPTVSTSDPLATIDAAVVDDWVDDRLPRSFSAGSETVDPKFDPKFTVTDADPDGPPTADPFNGPDTVWDDGATGDSDSVGTAATGVKRDALDLNVRSTRFEARSTGRSASESDRGAQAQERGHRENDPGDDATATRFMARTIDGTDIFPGREPGADAGPGHDINDHRWMANGARPSGRGVDDVPVPEISGARLQRVELDQHARAEPKLDIRSTLLAGRQESEWIDALRRRQVLILVLVTIVALSLIALIGFLAGGGDEGTEARTALSAGTTSGADGSGPGVDQSKSPAGSTADGPSSGPSTTPGDASLDVEQAAVEPAIPALRVSTTAVQICHSNYGGCVPVAADVDCEGDGDGPAFQSTPVAVFGDDVYGLDTDGDREACESDQPRSVAVDGG